LARKKRGFACNVVDTWFRSTMDGRMAQTVLDGSSRLYRYLRPAAVRKLFDRHASGREDHHKILFSLVVLEEWLRGHEEPVAALG